MISSLLEGQTRMTRDYAAFSKPGLRKFPRIEVSGRDVPRGHPWPGRPRSASFQTSADASARRPYRASRQPMYHRNMTLILCHSGLTPFHSTPNPALFHVTCPLNLLSVKKVT